MNCEECTLDGNAVKIFIPSTLQYNCLAVGQAPGKTEVVTGVPFTGSAGKMLYSLMKSAGLYKNQIPQTNLVQCKPQDDGRGNDLPPSSHEIKCCFRHLYEEIQDLRPELILAFGGPAMLALTGKEGPMSLRGSLHPLLDIYQHECQVLCLLHPSFVMRQRQWINIAVNDLQLVHKFFLGTLEKQKEYDFTLNPTLQELGEYLYTDTPEGLPKTFDIETTSLDPFKAEVLGIGFSISADSAVAVYFTGPDDDRIPLIKQWLEDPSEKKCAQNGSYDCKVLEISIGIKVRGMIFDTRLAEQILNSDMPKNLDHLRASYTQIQPYKPTKKEMKDIANWNKDKMLEYCCWDNVTTYQVMKEQSKLITPKQKILHETILVPLIQTINHMEVKGVKVDVDRLALMYAQVIPILEQIKTDLWEKYQLNPASPTQLIKFFNIKKSERTDLEDLINSGHDQREIAQQVLTYRDFAKGSGTFLKGVYERLLDGRIHTQYNIEGTGTGRLSSENPNLQNVPKPFRVIYTADTEDDVLISGDFKQIELWIAGLLGPCPVLINDLQNGVDIHDEVLNQMREYIPERLLWNARVVAKSVVFGTIYGRSPRSIAIAYSVPISTAEAWQEISFGRYPGLKKYYEDRREDFNRKRYVDTPFGRRRYIQSFPQALNAPIQSTAADVVLDKLNKCYYDGRLDVRLQVHDEIVIHESRANAITTAKIFKEIMESTVKELTNTSFPIKLKEGHNWYEMEEIKL
jgi:DNA polymerase-1